MKGYQNKTVGEIMISDVVTVSPGQTLDELKHLIQKTQFAAYPVLDQKRNLIGLVTQEDMLRAVRPSSGRIMPDIELIFATTVENIMSPRVITVAPQTHIEEVIDKMIEHNLRTIPVTEDSKLVGIIARIDIIKYLIFD